MMKGTALKTPTELYRQTYEKTRSL